MGRLLTCDWCGQEVDDLTELNTKTGMMGQPEWMKDIPQTYGKEVCEDCYKEITRLQLEEIDIKNERLNKRIASFAKTQQRAQTGDSL